MNLFKQKILVFGRTNVTNFGDSIIADCCKYLLEKTAAENHIRVDVQLADIYEEDPEKIAGFFKGVKKVVYPGGGVNSIKFNHLIEDYLHHAEENPKIKIYFNAIGLLRIKPQPKNEEILVRFFNHPQVQQVTTRGDFDHLQKYVQRTLAYPPKLVFDPAVWVNEAYQIQKDKNSDLIGIGVIRPEIFKKNGNAFSEEDVYNLYKNIIQEVTRRGYRWKLFTNGTRPDYQFGVSLLKQLQLDKKTYLGAHITHRRQLVEHIAGFKGIIAARMHANIIATSLDVPSVGLVWNDKMNLFAEEIGCEDRYIGVEQLKDTTLIVNTLEKAIQNGYDWQKIEALKEVTVHTIKNILN